MLRVLSLGWGIQSWTLAAMIATKAIENVDFVVHADTDFEHQHTNTFAAEWTPWLEANGVKVHTVKASNVSPVFSAKTDLPAFTWTKKRRGLLRRQCTGRWKIAPIRAFIREHLKVKTEGCVMQILGISLDELHRAKTSDVVARIERLCWQKIFEPEKVLATTFNRAAADSIKKKLKAWGHTRQVAVLTLHGLGYSIIQQAQRRRYLPSVRVAEQPVYILYQAISQARKKRVWYKDELERLDKDDFMNYIGGNKAQIRYCDLNAANLPSSALKLARQANAPDNLPWYLDLYQLFEECRQAGGWITFDDMLLTAWELLHKYPPILAHFQSQFQCVIVDEYQDINLVQSETLDLITALHRNYMAIGDDDQTIYQWRGAEPKFILGFEKRYNATKYIIEDNFRCPISQIVLSNQIIVHNENREPKLLSATQGFSGQTFLHPERDDEEMGKNLVTEIVTLLKEDTPPSEIVVLVRIYAQTPYIEQYLIEASIPYIIVGNVPFYRRSEVVTLLNYCYLAQIECDLQAGRKLTLDQLESFQTAFLDIYNKPKRYISRKIAQKIVDLVTFHNATLERAAYMSTSSASYWLKERINELCDDITWLSQRLDQDADKVLTELCQRLGYKEYIKETAGFPETAQGKVANVSIITDVYAKGKGNVNEFLRHIEELLIGQPNKKRDKDTLIKIMTIFRAKGLEWDHVFVPHVTQGTIPFAKSPKEEERRLFYVACTRSKKNLHLYWTSPQSEFLTQAQAAATIQSLAQLEEALTADPATWEQETKQLVATAPAQYHLERYFEKWATAELKAKQKEAWA